MKQTKITLEENEIPERWYNIVADMPNKPLPPLNPATNEPIGPEALAPLFPMALIEQEVSAERWIQIPDAVRDIYTQWRPTPMYRAHGLEKALDTPAHIYYKYEGVSPAGSHKTNTRRVVLSEASCATAQVLDTSRTRSRVREKRRR